MQYTVLIIIVALLACASPASNSKEQPEAVQRLSAEYREAFDLLPNGEWANRYYAGKAFGGYDPKQWDVMEKVYETRVCSYLMWDLVGSDDFEGLIDFRNSQCDLDKVLATVRASTHEPPSEEQFEAWVKAEKPEPNTADKIKEGLSR